MAGGRKASSSPRRRVPPPATRVLLLLGTTLRRRRASLHAQVFPESTDIRPHGQATFKVAFRPSRDGAFFAQQLLLVAHIKSQRNFRWAEERERK